MRGTVDPATLIYDPEIERTAKRIRQHTKQKRQAEASTSHSEAENSTSHFEVETEMAEENPPAAELMESVLAPQFTRPNSSIVKPPIAANNYDIQTWEDFAAKFFAEHFSMEKYNKLVNEITNFTQQPGETLCAAWTRYQELIRKCPQYDLPDTKKVRVFYNGMTPECRMIVNGAAGGTIGKKTADETLKLLDLMARNENASMAATFSSVQPKKGILQLGNNDASLAEHKVISQQLANLNAKLDKMQLSTSKVDIFNCEYCKEPHDTNECPTLNKAEPFQVNGIWYDPRPPQNTQGYPRNQNGGQGNNFQRRNQGSGLDYKSNNYLQPPPLPQKEPSELEKEMIQLSKTTNDHINETRAYHKNQDASIRNLESQIGQLSRQLAERTQGQFPGDTIVNPKEDCKSIVTRSGIVITPQDKQKGVQKVKVDKPVIEPEQEKEVDTLATEKEEPARQDKGGKKRKLLKL
ncbi:uncharacterized protein LOC133316997 [Gastrolobium bilobum]|uniref:uncharacterized protein LOC133316997 n=1 Tax=Gastrolobium bilobum TaxID=150636 RepID=UPI002AB11664|nr:uncharacterized protein LOC133316997 [Gastrolobium bilobum]